MTRRLKVYSDYKSPYAYLAKDLTYELEQQTGVTLEWLPYTLDIPAYLGSAKVDGDGNVLEQSCNAHQWRRVRYSYMDCRREANLRGLTIRGPRKIFDSRLANIGLLYARQCGVVRDYHDRVFERFWKRDLDIESSGGTGRRTGAGGRQSDGILRVRGRRRPPAPRGYPTGGRSGRRVRRAELPPRRRRPLLGSRAFAAHPRTADCLSAQVRRNAVRDALFEKKGLGPA